MYKFSLHTVSVLVLVHLSCKYYVSNIMLCAVWSSSGPGQAGLGWKSCKKD